MARFMYKGQYRRVTCELLLIDGFHQYGVDCTSGMIYNPMPGVAIQTPRGILVNVKREYNHSIDLTEVECTIWTVAAAMYKPELLVPDDQYGVKIGEYEVIKLGHSYKTNVFRERPNICDELLLANLGRS